MATTLLAVIAALAIGHLAPGLAAWFRQFGWYTRWLRWLSAQFPEGSVWRSRFGIVLALVLPLLVTGALQWGLRQMLWGLPALLFGMLILAWCWGPRDLDLDVAAVVDAEHAAQRQQAAAHLWPQSGVVQTDGAALVEAVFRNALRRWFAPLFWFCALGAVGALLYRLLVRTVERDDGATPPATRQGAAFLLALLDWPISQLMTLSLALVGNFDSVVAAWREDGAFGLRTPIMAHAARASVRSEIAEEVADYTESGISEATALQDAFGDLPELSDAMRMAWRILTLWLAVMALLVVTGWVH